MLALSDLGHQRLDGDTDPLQRVLALFGGQVERRLGELFPDGGQVLRDRRDRDAELGADLAERVPIDLQLEGLHLALSDGQLALELASPTLATGVLLAAPLPLGELFSGHNRLSPAGPVACIRDSGFACRFARLAYRLLNRRPCSRLPPSAKPRKAGTS